MKNVVIIITLVIVLFVFKSFFISVYLVRNRLDTQIFGERFVEIHEPYVFSFTPRHDNLNILIIPLKNPGLINKNEFTLKITSGEEIVREMKFSGYNIGDPSDVKFQFEPISISGGKTLDVEISSDDYQNPILINVGNDNTLSFRVYYRSLDKIEAVSDWIISWKGNIIQNFLFFAVWLIMLTGIVMWGVKNEKS